MPSKMHSPSALQDSQNNSNRQPSVQTSEEGRFVLSAQEFATAAQRIKGMMRPRVYNVIHAARKPVFERNAILLNAANINVHDTDHQDRDALIVAHIFRAFHDKLNQAMLEPMLVASMTHDSEYIPAALQYAETQSSNLDISIANLKMEKLQELGSKYEPMRASRMKWDEFSRQVRELRDMPLDKVKNLWMDGVFPMQINKKALDPHAELGEARIRSEYEDPAFYGAFGDWTVDQKEVAALGIRDHSIGSAFSPFSTPLEAQVLRASDKLDNLHHRVGEWMVGAYSLKDPFRCHRYVPTAIQSQEIIIDRAIEECRIIYTVDPQRVEDLMNRTVPGFKYSREEFIGQFDEAYGHKSMPIAAEVLAKLFAHEGEMYSARAEFKVELRFPDGVNSIKTYAPAPTAPTFS